MPGGLAKAVSDRILAGNLRNLNLYFQHSMSYSAETLIRPEVLKYVNARCFFMGQTDRKVVDVGLAEGSRYLSHVPINFSNIPRALTEHIKVNTFVVTVSPMDKSGRFSLGTNNDYASTVLRHCDRGSEPRHAADLGDSLVNDIHVIAQHDNLMSVNTAIEIDLYDQVNAEANFP